MKKIIIIPDSFKGSMSSTEVADIIGDVFQKKHKGEVIKLPVADGGEGSTECIIKAIGGTLSKVYVHSPENKIIESYYGITRDQTAVIEIAQSSGITRQNSYKACEATTYGFGEMIKDALDKDIRKFLICLGGSATTDCACGMASALGIKYINDKGECFIPTGGSLSKVVKIDKSQLDSRIEQSEFTIMSDVENPLYGPEGAAYVYAPQKGASEMEVKILDRGLKDIAHIMEKSGFVSATAIKGAGAAGGAGYGCVAVLGAKIVSGIDAMLDICQFDTYLTDCDLIITGEGKLDRQSMMGKVLSGIKRRANNIRIVSFCGICELDDDILKKQNMTAIEIGRGIPVEESITNGKKYLEMAADSFFEAWR